MLYSIFYEFLGYTTVLACEIVRYALRNTFSLSTSSVCAYAHTYAVTTLLPNKLNIFLSQFCYSFLAFIYLKLHNINVQC